MFDETVNGVVTRTYTYGLQRINEDQIVSGTWTPSFYGYDGGGTVRQLTSLAGTVTDTYNYDAFGNLLNSTGSTPNNYLYRGEQYDTDLNLYYLRARYYNPVTDRFTSMDPGIGDRFDPKTLHRYLYAGGNPVNALDPTGRDIEEYDVGTIGTHSELTNASEVGDGIENHHLLPKSIACLFEVTAGEMLSIALLPGPHQAYDNAWNDWFNSIGARGQRCNQQIVTIEAVLAAAAVIYEADPNIMVQINNWVSSLSTYGLP